jgi:hypothetical protein
MATAAPARQAGTVQGNLYVREDPLLAQLIKGWASARSESDVTSAEVVAHLRSRAMVIVHDHAG